MRIAFFASIDARSRARYLLEAILPILCKEHEIIIFSDSPGEEIAGIKSFSFLVAHVENARSSFDSVIHLFEDGRQRKAARFGLSILPGITWFLDYTLLDHGPEPLLNSPWQYTVRQLLGLSPEWAAPNNIHIPLRPHAYRESGLSPVSIFCETWSRTEFIGNSGKSLSDIPTLGGAAHSYCINLPVVPLTKDFVKTVAVGIYAGSAVEDNFLTTLSAVHQETKNYTVLCKDTEYSSILSKFSELNILTPQIECFSSISEWQERSQKCKTIIFPRYSAYGSLSPYVELALDTAELVLLPDYFKHQDIPRDLAYFYQAGLNAGAEIQEVIRAKEQGLFIPIIEKKNNKTYLLTPEVWYEERGFVPNVIFPCATLTDADSGKIAIYYMKR